MLQLGSKGAAVTNLQKNLITLHFLPLTADGDFGEETLAAVKKFQGVHNLLVDGKVGDETLKAITQALVGQIPAVASGPAPWMVWARMHLNEPFVTGKTPTDFDIEVFSHTNYGKLDGVMQPGCAALVCAALEETDYKSNKSARAKDGMTYGTECELKPGCIIVFMWSPGEYHQAFCDHIIDSSQVAALGGNQSHELNVSVFSRKYIVATRWPVK